MNPSKILEVVPDLPSTPQILPKLQALLRDSDSSLYEVADLFKIDAQLTAQIIRLSNSAQYASSIPAKTTEEAIQRVGWNDIYKLVSTLAASAIFEDELPLYGISSQDFAQYSLLCASLMRELSPRLELDADQCYTIGLLASLGKVVLNRYYLEQGIDGYREENGTLTPPQEQALLGFNHTELAATLLQRWNFPENIYRPIQQQLNPLEATDFSVQTRLLALCQEVIANHIDNTDGTPSALPVQHPLIQALELDPESLIDATLDAQNSAQWLSQQL